MKRSQLEKFLGTKVRVKLFSGRVEEGFLQKTNDEKFKGNHNMFFPANYYIVTDDINSTMLNDHHLFRCSHVTRLERILS